MKFILYLIILLSAFYVETRSYYGIGSRILGDKLLLRDTIYSETSIRPTNITVEFKHPIDKFVSYMELTAGTNVYAEVLIGYDNILHGIVTGINTSGFQLTLLLYGFEYSVAPKKIPKILNPNVDIHGMMVPDVYADADYEDEDFDLYDLDAENDESGVIAIGERQKGDILLYSDLEASDRSPKPANHSVVFRYIDRHYLTYAVFLTYGTQTASPIFTLITDHSLKAEIYQSNVNLLVVNFSLYGFEPEKKPDDYRPIIRTTPDPNMIAEKLRSECILTSSANKCVQSVVLFFVLIFIHFVNNILY